MRIVEVWKLCFRGRLGRGMKDELVIGRRPGGERRWWLTRPLIKVVEEAGDLARWISIATGRSRHRTLRRVRLRWSLEIDSVREEPRKTN